jgi:hypothetical protein
MSDTETKPVDISGFELPKLRTDDKPLMYDCQIRKKSCQCGLLHFRIYRVPDEWKHLIPKKGDITPGEHRTHTTDDLFLWRVYEAKLVGEDAEKHTTDVKVELRRAVKL